MKHPMQKIENGRFVPNPIVQYILDCGGIDLNDIARKGFSQEDQEHFAQLIGYSLNGFSELSYVSDEAVSSAKLVSNEIDWRDARIIALESTLESIRGHLRSAACEAFSVHPDDLQSTPE